MDLTKEMWMSRDVCQDTVDNVMMVWLDQCLSVDKLLIRLEIAMD